MSDLSGQYPILQFFEYRHLPSHLALISAKFEAVAMDLAGELTDCEETRHALRKLLEAKDCAVRAATLGLKK